MVISFGAMLGNILDECRDTEYVETFITAENAMEKNIDAEGLFELAYALSDCDPHLVMPGSVVSFLKTVYQLGIDDGNVICMNNMGVLYYTDRAGMQDYCKAEKYYRMAADKGFSLAASNLGYIYYYGLAGDTNYELAYRYFSQAALCGEIEAVYKVGDMYRYGYYVAKSEVTAYLLYSRAFNLYPGEDECKCGGNIMKRMGDVFYEGIGAERNYNSALMFYQRAEQIFYEQINDGDPFVQKDLDYVIKAQGKLRRLINKTLPAMEWKN